MNFSGIIVGAATFLIIGICHPIVIKMEYHWGKGSWRILLVAGLAFSAASIFVNDEVASTVLGAAAFSCFWGILEVFEQEKRVLKGWFPENPARHDYYERIRKSGHEPVEVTNQSNKKNKFKNIMNFKPLPLLAIAALLSGVTEASAQKKEMDHSVYDFVAERFGHPEK